MSRARLKLALGVGVLMLLSTAVTAQQTTSVYFLGSEDRNGDGVSDLIDGLNLYAVSGSGSARVNNSDELVRNYLPDLSSGSVAYVADEPDKSLALAYVDAAGQRNAVPLDDLSSPTVQYVGDVIWISALNADDHTVLVGYDTDLAEVARTVVALPNPVISFDPTGQSALAYDQGQQQLALYRLPALTPIPLDLPPLRGAPVWSPNAARFAVPIVEASSKIEIALIDPATGISGRIDPELTSDAVTLLQVRWSAAGDFLTYGTLPGVNVVGTLPLRLIDAGSQTISTLREEDTQLRLVSWSSDDRYALVSEASSPLGDEITVSYRILDTTSKEFVPGDPVNTFITPVAFAWQPGDAVLGILGTSLIDGKPGIFTFDVGSGAISTAFNTDDQGLLKGNILWSADGSSIVFTAKLSDPLSVLTGTENTLRLLDVLTSTTTVISPDEVSVLPYGIQVR